MVDAANAAIRELEELNAQAVRYWHACYTAFLVPRLTIRLAPGVDALRTAVAGAGVGGGRGG